MIRFALAALVLATAAPALAVSQSDIRSADTRVAQQHKALVRAVQSRDPVSVAAERAKLDAARAVAWGRRHPAPVPRVAAR